MESKILFSISIKPSFGRRGQYGGVGLSILENGIIIKSYYEFGNEIPIKEEKLCEDYLLAEHIRNLLKQYDYEIHNCWEDSIRLNLLDGPIYEFQIGDKSIKGVSVYLQLNDLYELSKTESSETENYYAFENQLIHFYNSIISTMNNHGIHDDKFNCIDEDEQLSVETKLLEILCWTEFSRRKDEFEGISFSKEHRLADHVITIAINSNHFDSAVVYMKNKEGIIYEDPAFFGNGEPEEFNLELEYIIAKHYLENRHPVKERWTEMPDFLKVNN